MPMQGDHHTSRSEESSASHGGSGLLPEGTRPLTVCLQVADLQRSLAFYTTVIGLQPLTTADARADLGVPDDLVPIVTLAERRHARPVSPHSRLGLYHFAILLPDRASLGRSLLHLAAADLRVASADHWVSEALYLSDPDGLGIEIYADRPRDTWPRAHGRVQMTTARLDLRDLAAAGQGRPWEGLPAGTALGHVHLHVGAMEDARQFYGPAGLGFEEMFEMPGALFLAAGGYHHHLGLNTWADGAPSPGADEARLLEWTLLVPGATAGVDAASRLKNDHVVTTREDDGWTATDPWGTSLRVVVG